MKIVLCTYTIHFSPILKIRERLFDIEKEVAGQFQTPLTLIPVPDNAPYEIPRITANSENGHTSMNISMTSAQVCTQFDKEYSSEAPKCIAYMKEKAMLLYSIIEMTKAEPLYTGLISQLEVDEHEDPVEYMKEKFIRQDVVRDLHDISMRLTYVADDDYYINIELMNKRLFDLPTLPPVGVPSLAMFKQRGHSLSISLDVNDRMGFNSCENYLTSKGNTAKIFALTEATIAAKMQPYINGGVRYD